MFFTPKWKKETQLLLKGAQKFLHYKRDLLKPDRIDEIESRLSKPANVRPRTSAPSNCAPPVKTPCRSTALHVGLRKTWR
jgi:hypothetical protein